MATQEDVRRVAMSLPGVDEAPDGFAFRVHVKGKPKGFVWAWAERVQPKKPRVQNEDVLVVMVPNLGIKELLLDSDRRKFFTEPHYQGYPAVFVRLSEIDADELGEMIVEAWRCKAPPALLAQRDRT